MATSIFSPLNLQITQFTSVVSTPVSDMDFYTQSLLMAELSALAYFTLTEAEFWANKMGFKEVYSIEEDDGRAFIFESTTDIVVAFRGTDNIENIKTDVLGLMLVKDGSLKGGVHCGFLNMTNKIWGKFVHLLDENDAAKKLWTCGHSLGGAVAAIASVRAERRTGPNVEGVFTFGQPRIGNHSYVKHITTPTHRWVHHRDLITKLPMWWLTYSHFGNVYYMNHEGKLDKEPFLNNFLLIPSKCSLQDHNIVTYRDFIRAYLS